MNRRNFAIGLVLGSSVVATAAHPQGAQPTQNLPNNDVEAKYQVDTLQAGGLSLETSRIALESASDPRIKEFANFEVAEQETIAQILKDMMTQPGGGKDPAPAPRGQERSGNAAAPQVSNSLATGEAIKKLRGLTGAAFDREYLNAQMVGHQKLLEIQEKYIADSKARESRNVALLARGMIKEHLVLLQHLQKAG